LFIPCGRLSLLPDGQHFTAH